ncbi:hypothetical protein Sgou_18460 [Streptomyces gougerotii]|uniref:Uncharacterized protein n=1 Tax=Streptomyces gougerotii TaxID=53448 RepID=A0A8H9HUS7_9ACTN|nr:hypothetical protein Sgou_18460 [Streptomyces gougerotii]GGU87553.1 hypothetical protein GCM10010227_47620 [Streptomyces gougerotii]
MGGLDDADRSRPVCEPAGSVRTLVDGGRIEVRRTAPWTAQSGERGSPPGEPGPRRQLPAVLASPGHPHVAGGRRPDRRGRPGRDRGGQEERPPFSEGTAEGPPDASARRPA